MSGSQFKAKSGRQRSRSAKPYERNNKNLASKVKSWLTPSSWLSYLSPASKHNNISPRTNDRGHSSTSGDLPVNPINQSVTNTHILPLGNHLLAPGRGGFPLSVPETHTRLTTVHDGPSASTSTTTTQKRAINTADLKATLSVLENELASKQDMSSSSNDSWVAEDTEHANDDMEVSGSSQGPSTLAHHKKKQKIQYNLPPTRDSFDPQEFVPGIVRALTPVQAGGNEIKEHTVQFVSNPAFSTTTPPKRSNQRLNKVTSGFSADFSRRLYSSSNITTSTPQLSPVREQQEEEMLHDVEVRTSPFNPVASQSLTHTLDQRLGSSSVAGNFVTPSRTFTNESISRSPFRSPFYSGRTSFGGAASHQKMRVKRPRTESSPPVLAPLRVSVRARPATPIPSASTHQSVVSQTAKRIMDTLDSLTSPLSDARKMPMRNLPSEMQQAKRRRVSETSMSMNNILSPPPVTPLHTTKQSKTRTPQTQIVPNEQSSPRKQQSNTTLDRTDSPSTSSHFSPPLTSSNISTKLQFSSTQFSSVSSSTTASVLSGLKFSAPPLTQQPSVSSESSSRLSSQSLFSEKSPQRSSSLKSTFRTGGKMSRRSRGARGRHPGAEEEEEEEEYYNPVAPPPQVGLNLGQGSSLPTFTFHSQLLAEKVIQKSTPPKPVAASVPLVLSSSTTPSFSFSHPIPLGSADTTLSSTTSPKISFGFSAPKAPLAVTTSAGASLSTTLQFTSSAPLTALSKNSLALKMSQPAGIATVSDTPPPPLKRMSVVDALKKPEYSQFLTSDKTKKTLSSLKSQDVVDLTNSDEEDDSSLEKEKQVFKPLPQFAPATGSWSCDMCFVSNNAKDMKCVACNADKPGKKSNNTQPQKPSLGGGLQMGQNTGLKLGNAGIKFPSATFTPLSQFAPPTGSWECGTCLINNKAIDEKCAACGSVKPTSKAPLAGGLKKTSESLVKSMTEVKQFPGFAPPPPGSWTCDTCMLSNKPEDAKCVACTALKPGAKQEAKLTSGNKETIGSLSAPSAGFKLNTGLSLGGGNQFKPLAAFAPPPNSWSCDTCMVVNKSDSDKCVACSASKPATKETAQPKVTDSAAGLKLDSTSGFKLGEVSLGALSKPATTSKSESTGFGLKAPSGQWTCETCWVSNTPENDKCVACSASKPGAVSQASVSKEGEKTTGVQLGSTGGFTLGTGTSLGAFTTGGKQPSLTSTTGLQLGSAGGFKLSAGSSLGSLTAGTKPPSTNLTFGSPASQSSSTEASKPETVKSTPSLSSLTTNPSLLATSGTLFNQQSVVPKPTGQLLFGASTTSASVGNKLESGLATGSPLTGIKLGGSGLQAATTSNPLGGIKLGGGLLTSSNNSTLKLGGGIQSTTASSSPLAEIKLTTSSNLLTGELKLGGGTVTTSTTNPLAGIKLGGSFSSSSCLTGSNLSSGLHVQATATPSMPKLQFPTTFAFGGTSASTGTSSTFNFTGAQNTVTKPAAFQFTGAATSANAMFLKGGSSTASSSLGTGLRLASSFGNQPLPLSTPAGGSSQAEMQSPDNDMNVENDKSGQQAIPDLLFGTPNQQQHSLPTNIFGGQSQPQSQTTPSFNFGGSLTKPNLNFGGSSSTSFAFSGNSQKQTTEPAKVQGTGLFMSSQQPAVVPSQSSTTGFNFNNSGVNLTFTATNQDVQTGAFTAESSTPTTGRIIKKARRRKQ